MKKLAKTDITWDLPFILQLALKYLPYSKATSETIYKFLPHLRD